MKKLILISSLLFLSGCAALNSSTVGTSSAVLLPEDRIFTIPAGQTINVQLDKKPVTLTFPGDMKLVSPTVLVRQEQQLNDAILAKTKADKQKNQNMGIMGAIFAALAAGMGVWFKAGAWFKGFQVTPKK